MADFGAEQYILMQQDEEQKAMNFRNLYQDVSNFMLPRENQITAERTAGEDKSLDIFDPTAMMDLDDMVSGLSNAFFPPGQQSFTFTIENRKIGELDHVKRYLAVAADITHQKLFASNFMTQLNETLTSLVGFGTGCLYSEFLLEEGLSVGLNFKAWDVPTYTIKQNHAGFVDTVMLKVPFTARQAAQKWKDKAGKTALEDSKNLSTESKRHWYLIVVRPRTKRNPAMKDLLNAPFEGVTINIKEKEIIEETGYRYHNPYAVPRWKKSSSEKYGRGQGTIALSGVKTLQVMWRDFIEFGNKCVNPPREVLSDFEGQLRVTPGAQNSVNQLPSSRPLDLGAQNYQFAEKAYEMQSNVIHRAFFVDVFAPLANLPGDRRTTVEIYQRVAQAMKKLAAPVYRLQSELFTPVIERAVLLLIEHGVIPEPPKELQGQNFGIEYVSELAMAMRDQQAKAFERFSMLVGQLEAVFPGAKDNISMDRALPDIALTFGVKPEHLSTPEEKAAIRQKREQEIQQQKAAMAAQIASDAYGKTTGKPEEGSAAQMVMAGAGAG
jgi:hypothetical protein